jgi:hypothetical protein
MQNFKFGKNEATDTKKMTQNNSKRCKILKILKGRKILTKFTNDH